MDFYYTPKRSPPFICYNPPLFNSLEPERLSYIPNEEPFQPRLPPFRTDDFSLNGGLESEIFITPLKKKDIELGITNKKRIDIGVEEALSDVIYYFKEIISFETELEKCREELARKADFRTSYLFSHFDLNNSHQIIIPEFQLGLKNLGIIANNDDIYMLIRRYSMDQIEKLNRKEFDSLFICKSESNQREIIRNDSFAINYTLEKIMKSTKIYILKLLRLVLDYEHGLEFVRHKLSSKSPDFQKIFCFIDLSKGNLLNLPEIKSLMSKYGYSIGDNEAKMILGRFDRNKSGQIGFKEFLEELNPRLQVFKKEI